MTFGLRFSFFDVAVALAALLCGAMLGASPANAQQRPTTYVSGDVLPAAAFRSASQRSTASDGSASATTYALGGVGLTLGGAAAVAGGIRVASGARENGGFPGPIVEAVGYGVIGIGAFALVGGVVLIVKAIRTGNARGASRPSAARRGWSVAPHAGPHRAAGMRLSIPL